MTDARTPPSSDWTEPNDIVTNQIRGSGRIYRIAVAIGFAAVGLSIATGFLSYHSSRRALVRSLASYNQVLSDRLADEIDALPDPMNAEQGGQQVLQQWQQLPRLNPGVFVCAIGNDGKLIAHSKRSERVGVSVGDVAISNHQAKTVGDLVKGKDNWVGENVNAIGKRQLAAYTYSEKLDALIVVHTPASIYEPEIRSAALPWSIGFGIATLCLWPTCWMLTHLAFARVRRLSSSAHQQLHDRFIELEHVYRTTPVGLCLMDTELRFLRINDQLAALHEIPADQHLGRTLRELQLNDVANNAEPVMQKVLATGVHELNVPMSFPDPLEPDLQRYFLVSIYPLKDHNQAIVGVSTVVQDVTSERRSEETRFRQQLELNHVSRLSSMGEMVAGIAHEINQPLAAISNYAAASENALRSIDCNSQLPVETWLHEIAEQAVRCGEIIRQLRKYVSKNDGCWDQINLANVIRDAVALITYDAKYRGIRIDNQTAGDVMVTGSEVQLQQVLVNLLRNASEAVAAKPSPKVTVQLTVDCERAELSVEDNGDGVCVDQPDSVFSAFVTTKNDGMGMGLAISKSIIEAHDGTLVLDTKCRSGAKFCISLPIANATN